MSDIEIGIRNDPQIINTAGHNIITTHNGDNMSSSNVDPRYRITIPKEIREGADFKVGDKIAFLRRGEQILLFKVPQEPLTSMRGSLKFEGDPREFLRKMREEDLQEEKNSG